ncbi:MAG TPA: hypothetical protein VF142_10895 [Longimicrobium sp.]
MPSIRPAVHLAAAAVLLALAACGAEGDGQASSARAPETQPGAGPQASADPPSPSLVGRWQGADDQVEFFAGGRMLLRRGEIRGTGRYEFVEARRVLLSWEGLFAGALPGDYGVRVAGDSLSLCETDRPARCIRYARVTDPASPPPPVRPLDPAVPRLAESPRGPTAPPEARTKEAEVVLKQAYTLQYTYKAERGTYAATMDSLRVVGWEPPPGLRYYHPPRVTQWRDRLCVVMEPRDADLWPVHVDDEGDLGRGRACR